MIVPSGVADYYAIEAESIMRVNIMTVTGEDEDELDYTYYRVEIRGTATKIPGFIYFSGRNTAVFTL